MVKNLLLLLAIGICMLLLLQRKNPEKTTLKETMKKAVAPDQMEVKDLADIENSKMVSEGSQFGVQYVNELIYE